MNEADVKADIVRSVRREGGYGRRIEDRFSVGMPDVILIPTDCPVVWLEAKIVRDNMFGPTERQLIELRRLRIKPHCTSYLIGWKAGVHYITLPTRQIHYNDCMQQLPGESIGDLIRRVIKTETLVEQLHGPAKDSRIGT